MPYTPGLETRITPTGNSEGGPSVWLQAPTALGLAEFVCHGVSTSTRVRSGVAINGMSVKGDKGDKVAVT